VYGKLAMTCFNPLTLSYLLAVFPDLAGLEIRPQTALISLRFVQTAAISSDRRSRRANQPVKNIYS
jgi:hypothetical protein